MLPYQEEYVRNVREAVELSGYAQGAQAPFEQWHEERLRANARIAELKRRNTQLLSEELFPTLDALHSAPQQTLDELTAFADALLDWKVNLDPGVYVTIHDALLSLYRVRRDRNAIIRELYKLGMGLYYQRRAVMGVDFDTARSFYFENEMVFAEAASYFRHFEEIGDEETQGYIIRSIANIALCVRDPKRKIAASGKVLQIVRDPHYREVAPGLPWDRYLRSTHQQMSVNRTSLSRGNMSQEELSLVLDSCYEVFKPEQLSGNPSVRWLWPYYEMEYNCGYVDLKTTLDRMERLIEDTPSNQHDMSGLYGCVQLPLQYGELLRKNPKYLEDHERRAFLIRAYEKLERNLMTFPKENIDDSYYYTTSLVFTNYFETEGVPSYRELTTQLIMRDEGESYIRARRAGALLKCLCSALLRNDPAFFDDIPFIQELPAEEKEVAVLSYAQDCAMFYDYGLYQTSLPHVRTRDLFENEYRMYRLHPIAGRDTLSNYAEMRRCADVAWGHHGTYNGLQGYPDDYERTSSPYRQMTDAAALVSWIMAHNTNDLSALLPEIFAQEGKRFSPLVTACLNDPHTLAELQAALTADDTPYYREIWEKLHRWQQE